MMPTKEADMRLNHVTLIVRDLERSKEFTARWGFGRSSIRRRATRASRARTATRRCRSR